MSDTNLKSRIEALEAVIEDSDPDTRAAAEAELAGLLERLRSAETGGRSRRARQSDDEDVEAMFDNMPV